MCVRFHGGYRLTSFRNVQCRLNRAFGVHGGMERTEQLLKFWYLAGGKATAKSGKHRTIPLPKEFPSFADLDVMPFTLPKKGKGRKRAAPDV